MEHHSKRQLVIAGWGVLGVALLFFEGVVRLGMRAVATMRDTEDAVTWLAFAASVTLFGYGEGYLALGRRFVPRAVARALAYGAEARGCFAVLGAPLVALGLLRVPRAELVRGWAAVAGVVFAVLVVQRLPFPWRGVVDAGVAVALGLGLVVLVTSFARICIAHGRAGARPEARP